MVSQNTGKSCWYSLHLVCFFFSFKVIVHLDPYPCFQSSLDVTETFKQQKIKLVQEGFTLDVTQDPLYFLDVSQKDYIPLTLSLYNDIVSGKINL